MILLYLTQILTNHIQISTIHNLLPEINYINKFQISKVNQLRIWDLFISSVSRCFNASMFFFRWNTILEQMYRHLANSYEHSPAQGVG